MHVVGNLEKGHKVRLGMDLVRGKEHTQNEDEEGGRLGKDV